MNVLRLRIFEYSNKNVYFKSHLASGLWRSDLFSQAVETIYNETRIETTLDLRDIALDYIIQHASELMMSDAKGTPTALAKVMDTIPEFSKDFAVRLLSENEKLRSAMPKNEIPSHDTAVSTVNCRCGIYSVVLVQDLVARCKFCGRSLIRGQITR